MQHIQETLIYHISFIYHIYSGYIADSSNVSYIRTPESDAEPENGKRTISMQNISAMQNIGA